MASAANTSITSTSMTSNPSPSTTVTATSASANSTGTMDTIFEKVKKHIAPISFSFVSILLFLLIIIVILVLYISHLKKMNISRVSNVPESKILSQVKTIRPRECTPVETQTKTVDQNNDDDAMYDYPEFMPSQLNSDRNSKIVEVMEENELYALSDGIKKQSMLDGNMYDTIDENLLKQNLLKQKYDPMKKTNSVAKPEVENSTADVGDDDLYATIDEAALKLSALQQKVSEISQIRSSVTDDDYACIDESALLNMSLSTVINNIPKTCCQDRDKIVAHSNEFETNPPVNTKENACNIEAQKVTLDIYTSVDMNAKKIRRSVIDTGVEEDVRKIKYIVQTGVVSLLEDGVVANDLITEDTEIVLPLNMAQKAEVKYLEENRDSMYESIDECALKLELQKLECIKERNSDTILSETNDSDKHIEAESQNVENKACIVSKDLLLQNGLPNGMIENETFVTPLNYAPDINLMNLHSRTESVECHDEIPDDVVLQNNRDLLCDTTDSNEDIVTVL